MITRRAEFEDEVGGPLLGERCGRGPAPLVTHLELLECQPTVFPDDELPIGGRTVGELRGVRVHLRERVAEQSALPGAVLEEREPELHAYRMLRGRHGAFEQLNNGLSDLWHLELIAIRRAGRVTDAKVRRRDYYLLEAGAARAQELRTTEPHLAWYDQQAAYVAMAAEGMSGGRRHRTGRSMAGGGCGGVPAAGRRGTRGPC